MRGKLRGKRGGKRVKNRRVFNAVSLSRLKRLDVLNSLKLISFLFLFNLYFHITHRKRNR